MLLLLKTKTKIINLYLKLSVFFFDDNSTSFLYANLVFKYDANIFLFFEI